MQATIKMAFRLKREKEVLTKTKLGITKKQKKNVNSTCRTF